MSIRFGVGVCATLALFACGTNQGTTPPAPAAVQAPVPPPPQAPAAPTEQPTATVQTTPAPSTREGRMSEALKDYEASKAAKPASAPAAVTTKGKTGKAKPAKKPANAASGVAN